MLDSLPPRPLTFGEADSLVDGSTQLAPLTILPEAPTDELRPGVYTLQVHDHPEEPSTVYLLGYNPEAEAWVRIHTFDADAWSVEEQDATIQAWLAEKYPDLDRGEIDVDTGDVEMFD